MHIVIDVNNVSCAKCCFSLWHLDVFRIVEKKKLWAPRPMLWWAIQCQNTPDNVVLYVIVK